MTFDVRKILRWTVNILGIVAAVATLPEVGAIVPATWLPGIGSALGVVNLILTWLRKVQSGEPLLKS